MKRALRFLGWLALLAVMTLLVRAGFHAYGRAFGAQAELALLQAAFFAGIVVLVLYWYFARRRRPS